MKNNKIIAISGQPVTGKGTTVQDIIKKIKEQGYSDENIHIIATGQEFRNYFNAIFELVKNYEDEEKIETLAQNRYLKVFLEKKEYRQILIDTISKMKQSQVDIHNLNIEDANNLIEFSDIRKVIDTIIDKGIEDKGKQIDSVSRPNDIWIVDSRLAFHNIPQAFSVRLISNPKIAAERLFNDKSRGKEDNYATVEEAFEAREKRRLGEQKRYKERYGVDLENDNNYDLIIDTSYSTTEDISATILKCLDCYIKEKPFAKHWASPKIFLPLQRERATLGQGECYLLEELEEIIKKDGYRPECPIEVIEVEGIKYIIEGHHRNFSSARLKKTLVPYEIIAREDEEHYYAKQTARQRARDARSNFLYGHEWLIGEDFSYNDVYPGIYEKLKAREEIEER